MDYYYWTDPINSQSGLRPLGFSLARVHLPPRPGPPGPAPPSSSGGVGAMAAIGTLSCKTHAMPGVGRDTAELTKDNHEGKDVNPIFLDKALLWLRFDDLALGRKGWR